MSNLNENKQLAFHGSVLLIFRRLHCCSSTVEELCNIETGDLESKKFIVELYFYYCCVCTSLNSWLTRFIFVEYTTVKSGDGLNFVMNT